ncbi:Crp/Fnr family transcriptional regulator [Haliangium ochraceum]|uniref:Transcriptional regulator, Crp/Fnr family n=1 Tax=Haliangium ochraceum (strain DSM 14365 / JCM 11303 / SMP-2) TaxID=502025 RepID=D0LJM5_HALO1|nr:Crp/Fnr family transcriptional regulator [Haliangium ochraceum]ACY16599.1 transcriptional regulator, Crp/Fnr family [Haliangium ochraceum DSM 14365]
MMSEHETATPCESCGIGHSSGFGEGGFCPFVNQSLRAGDTLYSEGDAVHHVWFVKQGTVVLSRRRSDDRGERVRTVRFSGGFVGLESLVSPVYIDTARVTTNAELCRSTCEGFGRWLGPKHTPARTALEASVRAMVADLPPRAAADGSAEQRVAEWLTHESPQTMQLPRRIVADLLGMRPETLSRALASLASRGAIAVSRTDLQVKDEHALETIARTG